MGWDGMGWPWFGLAWLVRGLMVWVFWAFTYGVGALFRVGRVGGGIMYVWGGLVVGFVFDVCWCVHWLHVHEVDGSHLAGRGRVRTGAFFGGRERERERASSGGDG